MVKEVDALRLKLAEAQFMLGLHTEGVSTMALIHDSSVKEKLVPWVAGHAIGGKGKPSQVEDIVSLLPHVV
jgi:hypothetical protein